MFTEINVLEVFFKRPTTEFNVREIARTLKISPATASKRLQKLSKNNFF